MPSFLPSSSPAPQPQRKKSIDVRTLSLAQLHHFAKKGSRRAKAELERRMLAADQAPAPSPTPEPARPAAPARARTPQPAPKPAAPEPLAPEAAAPAHSIDFPPLPEPDSGPAPAPWGTPSDAASAPPHKIDLDIGSNAAPVRHFTTAPFPSTEMLGELLPLADTSDRPYTPAYSVDVRPEDMPHAASASSAGDVPPLPHTPAPLPVFPKTEVLDDAMQRSAPSVRRAPAHSAPDLRQPVIHEPPTPDSRPQALREPRAPEELRHQRPRHTSRRPAGVPSRPMPLHIPEHSTPPAPSSILDSQQEHLAEHLAAISRQESAQNRADDVPRFIGLIIMIWGVLAALTGVVLLASGHGLYILASGAAVSYIGWLLYKLKRLALPVHIGFLLIALVWAWAGKSASLLEVLTQAAPLLIPALWMLVPSIREPLQ